jgi:hypothetical protein
MNVGHVAVPLFAEVIVRFRQMDPIQIESVALPAARQVNALGDDRCVVQELGPCEAGIRRLMIS